MHSLMPEQCILIFFREWGEEAKEIAFLNLSVPAKVWQTQHSSLKANFGKGKILRDSTQPVRNQAPNHFELVTHEQQSAS